MTVYFPHRFALRLASALCICALLLAGSAFNSNVNAAIASAPVLLSEAGSTRAIALDSVTWRREPFPIEQAIPFSADRRTRVMVFALNLDLLPGEEFASSVTADAEDGARRRYPLRVEYVGRVPGHEWMSAIIVRLSDEMSGETGDVLVRVNLRNVPSNRVRIGIGRTGGGPPDDAGSVPTPAPYPAPTPGATPTPTPSAGKASAPDAVRFLEQSSFGLTPASIERVQAIGFRAFLDEQFNAPVSDYPELQPAPITVPADATAEYRRLNYSMYPLQVRFYQNALTGQDQLRQRVAFALSQIFVVSGVDIQQPSSVAPFLRILNRGAFGNFRQLMTDVTLNPAMGRYLDMVNNVKPNPQKGTEPNENYARELLQLFTIGIYKLNQDGTLQLDAERRPIPNYDQETINDFARVFTGWTYAPMPGATPKPINPQYYLQPMVPYQSNHDTGAKELLDGAMLPAGQTAEKDLSDALDNIFNHPNVAPFISKQLIQHLVTSNPSAAYINRVASRFNNNGGGVRGDLRAVVEAILLDPEARGDAKSDSSYGHLREPVLLITSLLRAFNCPVEIASTDFEGQSLGSYGTGMGQNLFYSPSVFNYYPPTYIVPSTQLLGPVHAIHNSATALARANFVNTFVFTSKMPRIDLAPVQALAADPARLIDYLNLLLMHNQMSPQMRGIITQAVTSIPATQPLLRAQTAVYLTMTSSQYQVQK